MDTIIAAVALLVSLLVAFRQWHREAAHDRLASRTQALETIERQRLNEERSKAFVSVRLVRIDSESWWKIVNHGESTAWLRALHAYAADLPHDPASEHDDHGNPLPAEPPLHDPRLLPKVLPPGDLILIPADIGGTDPPYATSIFYSDNHEGYDLKGVTRTLSPQPDSHS